MSLTLEHKAWQLWENGVTEAELHMIQQKDFDYDDPSKDITMNQAVEIKWEEMFGNDRVR